ncbi:MAG: MaoC family dehydratase [Alphaproteobacteria bacterium]|jgi:acyl dehydratase|nr:MaoC family dehydratase [Alphaproteobacteria bacterium]|tara:strand:+ start:104 stop:565 length:462 start_codon:yes stop_codon:yes gene_type:complete
MTYLEDFVVGDEREFGRYEVTEEEIMDFARRYDNQPFHTDREAAKDSIYGGLIASGWHTCAMFMRMACDAQAGQNRMAMMGSPGFDDLKWLLPVRPGDVLSARSKILSATPSENKPDRGTIRVRNWVLNQNGDVVLEMTNLARYLRRPTGSGD